MSSEKILLFVIVFTVLYLLLEKLMRKFLKVEDVDTKINEKRFYKRGIILILILYFVTRSIFFENDHVVLTIVFGFICVGFDIYMEWKYSEGSKGYVASLIAGSIMGIVLLICYYNFF